ncbi:MAG TPA: pre-peptidase C-terminal domain-containing protein [Pirellulaceae bacterium]|nr:pre-peptidase C-terminal domain-containing protein [Pirellulaceae bacterium]HMO92160.1 pre-peptidase C-terminal domain-containing protein [Pirellulaceae bacterium]HMP68914.1 pre-peptidase C-terminal domain-containing protein [Pirellulaceae bacterium]
MRSLLSVVTLLALGWSMVQPSMAQPPDIDRWSGSTAITPAQGYGMGNPLTLTWGIVPDGTSIPGFNIGPAGNSNLIARMDTIYGSGPGGTDLTLRPWFNLYQSVFDRWSSISGLSYIYEPNDNGVAFSSNDTASTRGVVGVRPDVRIGGRTIDGNGGVLAFNFFPNVGDMVIDTNDNTYNNTSNNSRTLRNILAHEHGHGVGMSHVITNNSSQLMNPSLNTAFDGPQYHDILMAHRGYGDFNEKSFGGLGNDVAARATSLGPIADGGSVSIGNSARTFVVAPTATDFVSIDHSNDTDFYSFSVNSPGEVNILLEALGFTYNTAPQFGGQTIAFNTLTRSNLILALFDTDGTTQLAIANSTSFGGNESIVFDLNGAGTYFIRVTGINNPDAVAIKTQFYALTASFTAIPEPSAGLIIAFAAVFGLIRRNRKAA